MDDPADLLLGSWVHSREEDAEGIQTYRRADRPLPRTRLPRHVLTFGADGRVASAAAGPADSRVTREGQWSIETAEPLVIAVHWLPETCLVTVIELTDDMLKFHRSDTSIG